MASAFPQLTGVVFVTGVALANILILAGLACMAVAIFGWNSETIAASAGFRAVSALTGTLLLFYVYGTYTPRAAHVHGAQAGRTAGARTTQHTRVQETQQTTPQRPTQSDRPSTQNSLQPTPQQSLKSSEQSVAEASSEGLFSGKWKNADPKAASVLFLKVEEQGGAVTVRAWGMCFYPSKPKTGSLGTPASRYCDWGTGHGTVRDGAADVIWEQGPVLRRMRLLPAAGSLRVVLDNTYRDRRPPQHSEAHFAKSL